MIVEIRIFKIMGHYKLEYGSQRKDREQIAFVERFEEEICRFMWFIQFV